MTVTFPSWTVTSRLQASGQSSGHTVATECSDGGAVLRAMLQSTGEAEMAERAEMAEMVGKGDPPKIT